MNKDILRKPFILPAFIATGILLAVIIVKLQPGQQHEDTGMTPRSVDVVLAKTIPFRSRAVGYGNVEPAILLQSRAEVNGKITYIHPDLKQGGSLPGGTVVIRIEPVDYELSLSQTQSSLKQLKVEEQSTRRSLKLAQENLRVGEKELARKTEIYKKKLISRTALDAEKQKVLTLRQQVQDLQGKLDAYASRKSATKAKASGQQETLGRTEVSLPFDARIGTVSVDKDEFVTSGNVLFEALDISGVEINAQMSTNNMRQLMSSAADISTQGIDPNSLKNLLQKLGLQARVSLVGDALDGAVWDARVLRISESVDPTSRTAGIIVAVDRPYEKIIPGIRPPLLKGMYGKVEVFGKTVPMQVIPRNAVHQGRVYVSNTENKLEIREVQLRFSQGDLAVIKSGLNEGDKVIVTDLIPLIEGMPLKPDIDTKYQERLTQSAAGQI